MNCPLCRLVHGRRNHFVGSLPGLQDGGIDILLSVKDADSYDAQSAALNRF